MSVPRVLDFAVGNARIVIDDHVHISPASAAGRAKAAASDAVAYLIKVPELLDVDMTQIAELIVLIAMQRRFQLESTHPYEPITLNDPAPNFSRHEHLHGDATRASALSAP